MKIFSSSLIPASPQPKQTVSPPSQRITANAVDTVQFGAEKFTDTPKLGERFFDALQFAAELHNEQLRKGSDIPYVTHLLQVAGIALDHGADEDEAIAALLHDSIEDQGGNKTRKLIREKFGERVTAIVDGCTDADTEPKPPWTERKQAYIDHVRDASDSVLLVSASDKLHNITSIMNDYYEVGDAVWEKFSKKDKEPILWYYRELVKAFEEAENKTPRLDPLLAKLKGKVRKLHELNNVEFNQ